MGSHSLARAIETFTYASYMLDLDGSLRNVHRRYSLVPHATNEEAFSKPYLSFFTVAQRFFFLLAKF